MFLNKNPGKGFRAGFRAGYRAGFCRIGTGFRFFWRGLEGFAGFRVYVLSTWKKAYLPSS